MDFYLIIYMYDNEAESFGQRNEYLPPSLPPSLRVSTIHFGTLNNITTDEWHNRH